MISLNIPQHSVELELFKALHSNQLFVIRISYCDSQQDGISNVTFHVRSYCLLCNETLKLYDDFYLKVRKQSFCNGLVILRKYYVSQSWFLIRSSMYGDLNVLEYKGILRCCKEFESTVIGQMQCRQIVPVYSWKVKIPPVSEIFLQSKNCLGSTD